MLSGLGVLMLSRLEVLSTTLLGDPDFFLLDGIPTDSKNLSLASSTKHCGNLNFAPHVDWFIWWDLYRATVCTDSISRSENPSI